MKHASVGTSRRQKWWLTGSIAAAALALAAMTLWTRPFDAPRAIASAAEPSRSDAIRVETIKPKSGGIVRTTVQPGSAHSFESAELFAKVSGFLKAQHVDIGSVVKQGDLLAEIDVPELAQQLDRDKAQLRQAEADVALGQSQIDTAVAEQQAAEAYVTQAEAGVKRSQADRDYREKQYQRIGDLSRLNSVEKRLVDEEFSQLQSAEAGVLNATSAVTTAKAQVTTAAARVERAKSELLVAKAKLDVMRAEVAKTATLLSYTRITSPYDGLVTHRGFHRGAFIRAADQGGEEPVLSVDRVDRMRVVVLVPDRDVPYVQRGDPAIVQFDALPEMKFTGQVARVAGSENPQTRTMRVEIDFPNTKGLIRDGMYGQVEIELEKRLAGVRIPSACLVGDASAESAKVFVVRQNKAQLVNVKIGKDTGALVEVETGLTASDDVVVKPPATLADGAEVSAEAVSGATVAAHH